MNNIFLIVTRELEVNLFMAIVDFIPVILFMVGMGFAIKLAHGKINTFYFSVLCGGVFLGFIGGISKCVWKFVGCLGFDYVPLNVSFRIYQAIGFILIAVGLIALVINDKKSIKGKKLFSFTLIFPFGVFLKQVIVINDASFAWFIVMSIFTTIYLVCLSILCVRRKMLYSFSMYYISMILMFLMAALSKKFESGGDFASLNWIAQTVNIITQLFMAIPTYLLLKKVNLNEKSDLEKIVLKGN